MKINFFKIIFFNVAFLTSMALSSLIWATESFTVTSPQIKPGGTLSDEQVYNGFGCSGKNISPELKWENPPADTKSFAVTVYDPDAPTGSGWWHWIMFDIPAATRSLPKGVGPDIDKTFNPNKKREYINDFGITNYGGPCPPQGDKPHRYIFTVHALKVEKLEVPEAATHALVRFMIEANTIGKAQLTGMYGR